MADAVLEIGEVARRRFEDALQQQVGIVEALERVAEIAGDPRGRVGHDASSDSSTADGERVPKDIAVAPQGGVELFALDVDEVGEGRV